MENYPDFKKMDTQQLSDWVVTHLETADASFKPMVKYKRDNGNFGGRTTAEVLVSISDSNTPSRAIAYQNTSAVFHARVRGMGEAMRQQGLLFTQPVGQVGTGWSTGDFHGTTIAFTIAPAPVLEPVLTRTMDDLFGDGAALSVAALQQADALKKPQPEVAVRGSDGLSV